MPPSQASTNTPLPPSVEKAYYRKCIELKRRLNEVEEANDQARLRRARLDRSILKMRLERAFLLEQLSRRMEYVDEDEAAENDAAAAAAAAAAQARAQAQAQALAQEQAGGEGTGGAGTVGGLPPLPSASSAAGGRNGSLPGAGGSSR